MRLCTVGKIWWMLDMITSRISVGSSPVVYRKPFRVETVFNQIEGFYRAPQPFNVTLGLQYIRQGCFQDWDVRYIEYDIVQLLPAWNYNTPIMPRFPMLW